MVAEPSLVSSQSDAGVAQPLPWWAQALDVVALAAVVAVLPPMLRGPTRFHIGPLVVSLGSFWRPTLFFLTAVIVRHAIRREPTLLARVQHGSAKVRAACPDSVRAALRPFLLSRGSVLLVAYFAVLVFGYPGASEPPFQRWLELRHLPLKWDASYYVDIARDGYAWSGDLLRQQELAFFPAYPMIARAVGWLVGSVEGGLFVVAIGSFFLALTYFYRLARKDLPARDAESALLFLAFYPFAIFYNADYTESLFLLAAIAAFYHFGRCEWWRASAWSVLLGLTRPNGCLLSVALGAMAVERTWSEYRRGAFNSSERRRLAVSLLSASAPIVGLALHSLYIYRLTGDPLMWLRLQQAWGREYHGPLVLLQWLADTAGYGFYRYATAYPAEAIQSLAVMLAAASVWPVMRRFGVGYAVFILVNLVPPLVNGGMLSMGRFTSTLFPMFLWLAAVVPPERRTAWIAAFAIVQGFVATTFFTYRGLA